MKKRAFVNQDRKLELALAIDTIQGFSKEETAQLLFGSSRQAISYHKRKGENDSTK